MSDCNRVETYHIEGNLLSLYEQMITDPVIMVAQNELFAARSRMIDEVMRSVCIPASVFRGILK